MPEAQREAIDLGARLESLAVSGIDAARQPNGNRLAGSIKKSLLIQAGDGSANGNRTPYSGCRLMQPIRELGELGPISRFIICRLMQPDASAWCIDLKTISMSLGHTNIGTTAKLYAHVTETLQARHAEWIVTVMGGSLTAAVVGEFVASTNVSQKSSPTTKKARGYGLSVVAPTGIEPLIEDAD
jgi:hypothetical protein